MIETSENGVNSNCRLLVVEVFMEILDSFNTMLCICCTHYCVILNGFFLLKKKKAVRHFVFVHVFSLRNDKVLCALIDLSTAELAAVQQSDYSTVKKSESPKAHLSSVFCRVIVECLPLRPPRVKCYQPTSLNHG